MTLPQPLPRVLEEQEAVLHGIHLGDRRVEVDWRGQAALLRY